MKRLLMTSVAVLATVAFASAQPVSHMTKPAAASQPLSPASTQSTNEGPSKGLSFNDATAHRGQQARRAANGLHIGQASQRRSETAQEKSQHLTRLGEGEKAANGSHGQHSGGKHAGQQNATQSQGQLGQQGASAQLKTQLSEHGAGQKGAKGSGARHLGYTRDSANAAASSRTGNESATKTNGENARSAETGASSQGQRTSAEHRNPSNASEGASSQGNKTANAQSAAGSENTTAERQVQGANLSTEQRTRIEQTVLTRSDVPRMSNPNFSVTVGASVPTHVQLVDVPQTIVQFHPQWRGYSYFVANDEIVIVRPSRRIVAVIPTGHGTSAGARAEVVSGHSYTQVREIQQELKSRGLYEGKIDGEMGPRTKEAIIAFQRKQGLQPTGEMDSRTFSALGVNLGTTAGGTSNHRGQGQQSSSNQQSGLAHELGKRNSGNANTGAAQQKSATAESNRTAIGQQGREGTPSQSNTSKTRSSSAFGTDTGNQDERAQSANR